MHKVMIMAMVKKGKTGYGYMGIDKAYAPKERERRAEMRCKICPYCGANLGPGEKCDCQDNTVTLQQESKNSGNYQTDQSKYNQKEEIYHE